MSSPLRDDYPVPGGTFTGGIATPEGTDIMVREGAGCYFETDSGDTYLDYKMGSGPLITGHAHPHIVSSIAEQAENGTTHYFPYEPAFELAERIVDAVPCAEALKFNSTGTESTYLAIRLARAHTGRNKVLKFAGGYHGWHDQAVVSTNWADTDAFLSTTPPEGTVDSAGVDQSVLDDTLVSRYNDLELTREIIETHAEDLACVLVEPVMRAIPPVEGFHEGLQSLCDAHDVVLIWDEVVTGFRYAWGGAQEYYGVEPDLATYGKTIGGGTPLAAVAGKEDIMKRADPRLSIEEGRVTVGGTLNGNALSVSAGHATLDLLEREDTYEHLHGFANTLRSTITDLLADSNLTGWGIGEGPLLDYVISDTESDITDWRSYLQTDLETKREIDRKLFEHGIAKSIGGKMYTSTEHGDEELERTKEAFKQAIETVA